MIMMLRNKEEMLTEKELKEYCVESYDLLKEYDKDYDMFTLLRKITDAFKERKSMTDVVIAFIDLRRLLKYHKTIFYNLFNNIFDYFTIVLSSENNSSILQALLLLKELFTTASSNEPQLMEWLAILLPKLLIISSYEPLDDEFSLMNHISNQCLTQVCNIYLGKGVVNILIDQLDNTNNPSIPSKAHQLIIGIINGFYRDSKSIDNDLIDWEHLFTQVHLMSTKDINIILALNLLETLKNSMKTEQWNTILSLIDTRIKEETYLKGNKQFMPFLV